MMDELALIRCEDFFTVTSFHTHTHTQSDCVSVVNRNQFRFVFYEQ